MAVFLSNFTRQSKDTLPKATVKKCSCTFSQFEQITEFTAKNQPPECVISRCNAEGLHIDDRESSVLLAGRCPVVKRMNTHAVAYKFAHRVANCFATLSGALNRFG